MLYGQIPNLFLDSNKIKSSKLILVGEYSHLNIKYKKLEIAIINEISKYEKSLIVLKENKSFVQSFLLENSKKKLQNNISDTISINFDKTSISNLDTYFDLHSDLLCYGIDIPQISVYSKEIIKKLDSLANLNSMSSNKDYLKFRYLVSSSKIVNRGNLHHYSSKTYLKIYQNIEKLIKNKNLTNFFKLILINLSIDAKINSLRSKSGELRFNKFFLKYFVSYRDSLMAINLRWIISNLGYKKYIILASNYHIKSMMNYTNCSQITFGTYIKNEKVYSIATYFIEDFEFDRQIENSNIKQGIFINDKFQFVKGSSTEFSTDIVDTVLKNKLQVNKRYFKSVVDEIILFTDFFKWNLLIDKLNVC